MYDNIYYYKNEENTCSLKNECLRFLNVKDQCVATLYKAACTNNNNQILFVTSKGMIMKKKTVKFLFVGRTCSGKSSIAKAVSEKLGLRVVKSYTTRQPRNNEKNGESDHYFISEDEFDMLDSVYGFVAETEINNVKYATTYDELKKSDIYVIDPNGVENLMRICGSDFEFVTVYIRVPYKVAEERYVQRGGTKKDFKARYDSENDQFKEYEKRREFDFHLLNDGSLEDSVSSVCEWIKKMIKLSNIN